MQKRTFGKLDFQPSLLGFGCMRLPVTGPDKVIDEAEAIRMIRFAIDQGVNYVDTAYNYHNSQSEIVLGKALQDGYRAKVKLATKNPSFKLTQTHEWLEFLDEQLTKLQTDHIDFYLQHGLNAERFETFKKVNAFEEAKKAKAMGKIKYFGFSFHDKLEVFKEIVDAYPWDFCQIQLNYLDTDFQAGIEGLRYAAAKGLGVVVMEPLRGGRLAANLPADIQAMFDAYPIKKSPAEWALNWVANQPEVSLLLSGMSTMEQVKDNLRICSTDASRVNGLQPAELQFLQEIAAAWKAKVRVGCTGCRYCMPCPQGVNIPRLFSLYNNAAMFDSWDAAIALYQDAIEQGMDVSHCVQCGACVSACPQQVPVIEKLQELHRIFSKPKQ